MNIADRIKISRKRRGISQEELADKMGVSRQAISKWESGQSFPDIDKIVLLSEYFDVTTDYLLKGIEPLDDVPGKKNDASLFSVVGTSVNFIGLILAIAIWITKQSPISVAIGVIIMAMGCMIFAIGQFTGDNKKKASLIFWSINIWLLSLIPISCIFNWVSGLFEGHWWTFTPTPQLGNSIIPYAICWLSYFAICIVFDIVMLKRRKR